MKGKDADDHNTQTELDEVDKLRYIIESAFKGRRLVLFSGGNKVSDEQLLQHNTHIIQAGGQGTIIGRNIFQRPFEEAVAITRRLMQLYSN